MLPLQVRVAVLGAAARLPSEGAALALVLNAGPRSAGALIAASTLPQLVTGPLVGRVLDRSARPHRVLAVAVGLTAVGLVCLGASGAGGPPALAGALVLAITTPALTGGLSSIVSRWPADEHLLSAWDGVGYNVAGLAAPAAVTALAVGGPGSTAGFYGLACGSLVGLVALAAAPAVPTVPTAPTAEGSGERARLRDAGRLLARTAALRAVTVSTVLLSAALGGFELAAAAAARSHGLPIERAGWVVSAVAAGALFGSVVMTRLGRTVPPVGLTLAAIGATGATLLLMAVAPWRLLLIGAFCVGVLDGPLLLGTYRTRTQHSPPGLRACVFTLGASAKLGAGAVGALAAASVIGPAPTTGGLAVIGATALAAAAAGIVCLGPSASKAPARPGGPVVGGAA